MNFKLERETRRYPFDLCFTSNERECLALPKDEQHQIVFLFFYTILLNFQIHKFTFAFSPDENGVDP